MEENVTITKKEYFDLLLRSEIFQLLECGGVDNWSGWDFSMWDQEETRDDVEERIHKQVYGE